ncbi:MAG: protein disulfide oxidoreductase [Gammaproteobacteria bacterium]
MVAGKKHWCRYLVNFGLLIVLFSGIHWYQTRHVISGAAPDIEAIALKGKVLSLREMRGRPVLVHFWATWCPVCKLENAAIESIARKYAVLSVVIDDTEVDVVVKYMEKHQLTYPTVHDPSAEIALRYGVTGVPASFIIDGEGNVRFVEVGYTSGPGLRARLWWAGL